VNKLTSFLHSTELLRILSCLFLLATTSCKYFETIKVDSDDLYKQEFETISWDEVDQYPLFAACDESAIKDEQRLCFQRELSRVILENIATKNFQVYTPISDTITLSLDISNAGKIKL